MTSVSLHPVVAHNPYLTCPVARHQANHARLQSLRTEADALEEQLKSSVAALATLRKELLATPATVFPSDSRPVPFDELLQYAQNISRYTVPPTFRERVPDTADDSNKNNDVKEPETLDAPAIAPATNGLNTPTTVMVPVEAPQAAETAKEGDTPAAGASPAAVPELSASEAEWLQKLISSGHPWTPWPDKDKILRGNLWKLYWYREKQKRNMDDFDIEAHEEDLRKQFADDPEAPMPEGPADVQPEPPVQEQPVQQAPPPQAAPAAPAAGGFTLFDDMESDED